MGKMWRFESVSDLLLVLLVNLPRILYSILLFHSQHRQTHADITSLCRV